MATYKSLYGCDQNSVLAQPITLLSAGRVFVSGQALIDPNGYPATDAYVEVVLKDAAAQAVAYSPAAQMPSLPGKTWLQTSGLLAAPNYNAASPNQLIPAGTYSLELFVDLGGNAPDCTRTRFAIAPAVSYILLGNG